MKALTLIVAIAGSACIAAPFDARLRAAVPASANDPPGAPVLDYELVVVLPGNQAHVSFRDSLNERVGASIDDLLRARGFSPARSPTSGHLRLILIHGDSTELRVVHDGARTVYRAPAGPPRRALEEVLDAMLLDLPR